MRWRPLKGLLHPLLHDRLLWIITPADASPVRSPGSPARCTGSPPVGSTAATWYRPAICHLMPVPGVPKATQPSTSGAYVATFRRHAGRRDQRVRLPYWSWHTSTHTYHAYSTTQTSTRMTTAPAPSHPGRQRRRPWACSPGATRRVRQRAQHPTRRRGRFGGRHRRTREAASGDHRGDRARTERLDFRFDMTATCLIATMDSGPIAERLRGAGVGGRASA